MEKQSKTQRKLLIVDDEPALVEILQEYLGPVCDQILTAKNGAEALSLIRSSSDISAVLSDINMPVMTGLELLETLRKEFNAIPFVVLTAYGDKQSYQKAVNLNATDFLEKPYEQDALIKVMERAIQYGNALIECDRELDELFKQSKLTAEEIEKIKRAKRTASMMRFESAIYQKN
jgi:two-component system, NtrC family, response regulator AtoC